MTSLILLNELIQDIDILKTAIKVPYVESEQLVSDIINSESGTHEFDQKIVNHISNLDSSITTIALLYENISMIPDGFEVLCASLPQHIKTIDLLTCNLNDEESITTLKTLESLYNKTIRYSVDLTGHEESMGNWMLESHNVEVRDIYFNNKITEWKHVLVYVGSYNTYYYTQMWDSIYDVNHNELTWVSSMQTTSIHSAKMRTDITILNRYTMYKETGVSGIYIPPNIIDWDSSATYLDKTAACATFVVDSNVFSNIAEKSGTPFYLTYSDDVAATKTIFILWKDIPGRSEPLVSNIYHPNAPDTYNRSNLVFVRLRTDAPPVYTMKAHKNETILLPQHLEDRQFSFSDFSGIDFSNTSFKNSILSSVNLSNANLSDADLSNADLTNAILSDADLSNAVLDGTVLSGVDLTGTDLTGANLTNANLSGTKTGPLVGTAPISLPTGAEFVSGTNENWIIGPGADLNGADLSGMDLTNANLSGTKTWPLVGSAPSLPSDYTFVSRTNEQFIIGPGIDLSGSDLSGMDFSNLNLTDVILSGAKTWQLLGTAPSSLPSDYIFVSGTNENGIIGPGIDLSGADLSGAYLTGLISGPFVGSAPSSLPAGYEFVSGTNEQWITGPGVDLNGADLSGADLTNANLSGTKTGPLVGTAPTLPDGYTFVSGTNEQWIIGPGADLNGADLSGMDFSNLNLTTVILSGAKTGPLIGSAPSLPDGYDFVSGTNIKSIIGPAVDLSGADLSGMDFSNLNLTTVILSGAKTWPLLGTAPSLPSDYIFVSGTNEKGIIGPGADLSGADLTGTDLTNANLSGAKTGTLIGSAPSLPSGYDFVSGTNIKSIIGPAVDLSGADLSGMDFSNLNLTTVILSGAKTWPLLGTAPSLPSGYDFVSGTNEKGIIGPDVNLDGADLSDADLTGTDLTNANLSGAKTWPLVGSAPSLPDGYDFVSGTNIKSIIGPAVDLSGADLSGMDLSNIDLTDVKTWPLVGTAPSLPDGYTFISGTNAKGIIGPYADLTGADLTGADLTGVDIEGVDFTGAILYGAKTGSMYISSSVSHPLWLPPSMIPSLPSGYTFDTYQTKAWIIGPYVDFTGVDLYSFSFNSATKTGPLTGSAPLSLIEATSGGGSIIYAYYVFVIGTNEKWIIGPRSDLTGADLRGMNLTDIRMNQAIISGTKTWPLSGSEPEWLPSGYKFVSGTNENGIIGPGVDLNGADLSGADLTGLNLSNADLSNAILTNAKTGPLVGSAPSSLPTGYRIISRTSGLWIMGPDVMLPVNVYNKIIEDLTLYPSIEGLTILNSNSDLTNMDLSNKTIMVTETDYVLELDNTVTIDNTKFINVKFNQNSIQYLQNKSVALIDCTLLE